MPTKGHASYLLYNIRILFNHPCAKVVILPETTKYFGKNLNDTLETPDIPDIPETPENPPKINNKQNTQSWH